MKVFAVIISATYKLEQGESGIEDTEATLTVRAKDFYEALAVVSKDIIPEAEILSIVELEIETDS